MANTSGGRPTRELASATMMLSGGVGRYGLGVDFAVVTGVMVAGVAIGPRLYPGVAT